MKKVFNLCCAFLAPFYLINFNIYYSLYLVLFSFILPKYAPQHIRYFSKRTITFDGF
jgi:hypothetical protein